MACLVKIGDMWINIDHIIMAEDGPDQSGRKELLIKMSGGPSLYMYDEQRQAMLTALESMKAVEFSDGVEG